MINLLLVDDETISIEILQNGIDWHSLGIDNVYTAMSMAKACELFDQNSIDIMICDIEMPQKSGLELLRWVRANNYSTINIFLTGHADFEYAKIAIELQSMEYLLKPISFDKLEEIVRKAVGLVNLIRQESEHKQIAEQWQKNKPKRLEQFWREIILGAVHPSIERIMQAAASRNILVSQQRVYTAMLISSKQDISQSTDGNHSAMSINTELNELFYQNFLYTAGPLVFIDKRNAIAILEVDQAKGRSYGEEDIRGAANHFACQAHEHLGLNISVTIGSEMFADQIPKQASELLAAAENNVQDESYVEFLDMRKREVSVYHKPAMELWIEFLREGKLHTLIRSAERYLDEENMKQCLSVRILTQFQHDYWQMIQLVLEERGFSENVVFNQNPEEKCFSKATVSIQNMKEWLNRVSNKAVSVLHEDQTSVSVIDKIKGYIEKNICHDISRNEIAQQIQLNPEYLSRIFHKETGVHLTRFIQAEKMRKARKLLIETDISIGEIASLLGYSNFAYFSRVFKSSTGVSPKNYRKNALAKRLSNRE